MSDFDFDDLLTNKVKGDKDLYKSILTKLVRALDELEEILAPYDEDDWIEKNNPSLQKLVNWTSKHSDVMGYSVFKGIQESVNYFIKENREELSLEEIIGSIQDSTSGIDLIGYARKVAGMDEYYDSSFPYFKQCEDEVERIRRHFTKTEPGQDKGYIYILTNPSMPDILKIGYTHRDPSERTRELSDHTGVPTPFNLSFKLRVSNSFIIENKIHRKMSIYRINESREFFKIGLEDAISIIKNVVSDEFKDLENNNNELEK